MMLRTIVTIWLLSCYRSALTDITFPPDSYSSIDATGVRETQRNTTGESRSPRTSGDNHLDIACSGEHFGRNPSVSDCQSAWHHIAPDFTQATWGQRHSGLERTIFPLPFRMMGGELTSSKGHNADNTRLDRALCFFQTVILHQNVRLAHASLYQVKHAAERLILECATGSESSGGVASNIGQRFIFDPINLGLKTSPRRR